MTEERLVLTELLEKAGDGDFLRVVAEAVLQLLMESDVEGLIGAGRYERSGERTTWRNGYRGRTFDTRLGALQLRIPKLRQGSYFPPFLEARKSSEPRKARPVYQALNGVAPFDRCEAAVSHLEFTTHRFSIPSRPSQSGLLRDLRAKHDLASILHCDAAAAHLRDRFSQVRVARREESRRDYEFDDTVTLRQHHSTDYAVRVQNKDGLRDVEDLGSGLSRQEHRE